MRLIAQFGNGVDNIDVEAAYAAGKTVTNTPSVLTEDTADMAMALIVAVPRRLVEGARVLLHDGTWAGWSPTWMLGRRLGGKALGIVGMGRIGTAVARRAKAFGLDIHYHSRDAAATGRSKTRWRRPTGPRSTRCSSMSISSPCTRRIRATRSRF